MARRMHTRKPLVVISVVGLTQALLGEHTPNLNHLMKAGCGGAMAGIVPAVTTSAQATMLTGSLPHAHGIVGNGWYWRDQVEVKFWQQSNHLVQRKKVWETLRSFYPDFVCSKLFWWYNMYSSADYSVTPRPHYPADGRKVIGLYSKPSTLHERLEAELGPFPFFNFWGPTADIRSSEWIAEAAALEFSWHRPNLQLVYLPHLDYNLQRLGPEDPAISHDVAAIDAVVGRLIAQVRDQGAEVMVVSEYGVTQVNQPVHINRLLREHGFVKVRRSLDWELLDCGASRAFAVADHQIAHVYVNDKQDLNDVKALLASHAGIEHVLGADEKRSLGLDHPRSGDLVAIAEASAWFTYYYWQDDAMAPDFAPTVDIHRKPGYDPVELFVDPKLRFPKLKIMFRLAQKAMGQRMLMDVIPLDAMLVKGSHGRPELSAELGPIFMSSDIGMEQDAYKLTDVYDLILRYFDVKTINNRKVKRQAVAT